jgi:hypothetical protein
MSDHAAWSHAVGSLSKTGETLKIALGSQILLELTSSFCYLLSLVVDVSGSPFYEAFESAVYFGDSIQVFFFLFLIRAI